MTETRTSINGAEADKQYVSCVRCTATVDITESHPTLSREEVNEIDEDVTVMYHFCSGDCRSQWKRETDYNSDSIAY
ncbi:hypothetical protein [Haladaptatus sp. DYF46]|uniref:DUF7576 family protein n=1 Tax=Haladaptatus sp. DYF46 TaxID=2886041 RepID=UPI001E5113D3|nr:hypothetical protein [Haladaptatus sp. DYF46]